MEMATVDDVKAEIKDRDAEERKTSGKMSCLGSIVIAVEEHPGNAAVLLDAATKLQEHTKKLKTYVATASRIVSATSRNPCLSSNAPHGLLQAQRFFPLSIDMRCLPSPARMLRAPLMFP